VDAVAALEQGTSTEAMPHTPTLSGEARVRSSAGDLHAATLSHESLLHQSDERLVALTRAGSERAFSEITRRYQRQLRAYCSRLVGVERAQDAVQQALLQAFLSLRDGAPRQIALRPWLYRIAHNCSIDLLRMGSWEYEQLDLEFDGVPQPPALFEQKQELREMIDGMRRLPEAQRQALTLRELEGCSYEEISARLGHTGSGVRQLIFRARSALRKGAAALVPFGALRERLFGMAPAVDSHQVAGMAAVPASSGGGLETVGAAALAVVAVLGGVAGGVRTAHHRQSAEHGPTPASGVVAPPAAPVSPATARVVRTERAGKPRHRASRPTADAASPAAPAPLGQSAVPVQVVTPAAPVPAAPAPVPATPSEPSPADGPSAVEQQMLSPAAEPDGAADQPAPPAPPALPEEGTSPAPSDADAPAPSAPASAVISVGSSRPAALSRTRRAPRATTRRPRKGRVRAARAKKSATRAVRARARR
jgi:RNA polymerase sigma factor (sigma-70 family)